MNNYVWTLGSNGCLLYVFPASCGPTPWMQILVGSMRERKSSTSDLHAQISDALRYGRVAEALDLYERIERRKPDEPRWSHRKGDLLRRMGRDVDAVMAYQRAAALYAAKGFEARALATAKLMQQILVHE